MRWAAAAVVVFLCLSVGATADDNLLKEYRANLTALSPRGESKEIVQATAALQRELTKLLGGKALPVTAHVEQDGTLVFGSPMSHSALFGTQPGFDALAQDGYLIRSATLNHHNVTMISAKTDAGVLNGVHAFLDMLNHHKPITSLGEPLLPKPAAPSATPGADTVAPVGVPPPVNGRDKPPPAGQPAAVPPPAVSDGAWVSILGIDLDLKWVGGITALSLLLSLSALILALVVSRRNRMSNPALRTQERQYETSQGVHDRLSRLENVLRDLLARHPELARPQAERPVDPPRTSTDSYDDGAAGGGRSYFGDEPEWDSSRPARAQAPPPPARKAVVSDRQVDQETHNLVSEYHKLIARRLSGLQDFIDRYGAQPIEPMSETGLFRTAAPDQDNYLWAVSIADRDDYIVILPGKEMIRRWSLFSKAAGSGARPYLNGAYNLTTGGRGELAVLEPAIATFDAQKKIFVLQGAGSLSGAT